MKIVDSFFDLFTYQEIKMFPVDAIKKKKKARKNKVPKRFPSCNNVKSAFVSVLFPSLSSQLSCSQLYLTIITADFLYCTVCLLIPNS